MHERLTVTVDSTVLACPEIGASRDEILDYVDALSGWSGLAEEAWATVCISDECFGELAAGNRFPDPVRMKQLWSSQEALEYPMRDVSQVVHALWKHARSFEEHYKLIEVEVDGLACLPELDGEVFETHRTRSFGKCVAVIGLLTAQRKSSNWRDVVVVHGVVSCWLEFTVAFLGLVHSRDDLEPSEIMIENFAGRTRVCSSLDGLFDHLDAVALLREASDEECVLVAIRISRHLRLRERNEDPRWDEPLEAQKWRLGRHFCESLSRLMQDGGELLAKRLLRSIVKAILREELWEEHAIRIDAGGGAPQKIRARDGAKAVRRRVDSEFRLHYWICPNGVIELASVGPHNDFRIPE